MTKPVSELRDHVGYWLRFVSNHVSHAFAQKVEARGVTVAEWVLMRAMFDAGAANPSQLADQLGLTRGAVSKLVERLCQKNLTARSADGPDRRYQTVTLTPRGRKLVPLLARIADQNDHEFFGHLSAERRAALIDQLTDLVRHHGWKDSPVN